MARYLHGNEILWTLGYFISSVVFFGMDKSIDKGYLFKISASNAGIYAIRKIAIPFLTPDDDKKANPDGKGLVDFFSKYSSNIIFDATLSLAQLSIAMMTSKVPLGSDNGGQGFVDFGIEFLLQIVW